MTAPHKPVSRPKRGVAGLIALTRTEQAAFEAMASATKVLVKLGIENASDTAITQLAAAIMRRDEVDRLMTWQPKTQ